jgi:Right handed beta helix region
MKILPVVFFFLLVAMFSTAQVTVINVADFGATANSFTDATPAVKKAILSCKIAGDKRLIFPEGRYDFWPDEAEERNYFITNTSTEEECPSKLKKTGLLFEQIKDLTIEGNHSLFVFHGKMITWTLDHCENIRIQNVRMDYERPGMSEMTIKAVRDSIITAVVHPDSKFTIINSTVQWYGEQWVSKNFHAILVDTLRGINTYSSWEPFLKSRAVLTAPYTIQFKGDFSGFKAMPGNVLTIRDRYRDYVGAFVNVSKNISLHNVQMRFMHGLGIVSQFSENLHYDSVMVKPAEGSGRMMASSADGMHFSGCKGQILVENCQFRGLHDDPINVHGTHLTVSQIISATSLKVRFMHGQTYGFEAFFAGDSVAFLQPASLQIYSGAVVKTVKLIAEREMLLEFSQPLIANLKLGDCLENITCTPAFTLRNCRFESTNTRGLLVTTRRKVLIEGNTFFRTGMHAILIGDDALSWYESGPVEDVTIRNNTFEECGYNIAPDNYMIAIAPENHLLVAGHYVHRNIRIENNVFKVYDAPLVKVRSTDGFVFSNNTINQSTLMNRSGNNTSLQLTACSNALIQKNIFHTEWEPLISFTNMAAKQIKADVKKLQAVDKKQQQ